MLLPAAVNMALSYAASEETFASITTRGTIMLASCSVPTYCTNATNHIVSTVHVERFCWTTVWGWGGTKGGIIRSWAQTREVTEMLNVTNLKILQIISLISSWHLFYLLNLLNFYLTHLNLVVKQFTTA